MMEHVTAATLKLQFVVERQYTCSSEKRGGREREKIKLITKERWSMWGKRDRGKGVKYKGRSEE